MPARTLTTGTGGAGFELFDLTVYLGPKMVPWVSAVSRLGHVHGIPRRDPKLPSIDDMLDSVYDFVDAVRFAEREPDPQLAHALGQLVFGEPAVLELFQATRGAAADRGHELLVRILASPHLAVLPWELLPDPADGSSAVDRRFLALAPDATVVRLARGRTYPVRNDPVDPPLNLLVVLSSPIGRDPADDSLAFDIYEEKRSLLAELAPLVDDGLLTVDVEEQPTLENLRRKIGQHRRGYHLFHYLGHAEPDRLILEDEQGRRDDQSGTRFTQILRLCPDLRLAVFAGCETARAPWDPVASDPTAIEEWRTIFSLADRCVQDSCPMVVGMQAVLPFRTERLFTRFFYQSIASGYSVASAVRLARSAARGDRHVGGDLLDWSVPVLFVGGSEPGPLLDRAAVGPKPAVPPRHLLRLGLRQRERQFFARDVALRQAIDVLSGEARERILIVTGPSGVGKTFLIDRALEELAGPISILYVKFEALMPGLDAESLQLDSHGSIARSVSALRNVKPDAVLEKLCVLVARLLARGDRPARERDQGSSAGDWWPLLVEDLAAQRFVLVIDNLDLLVAVEKEILRQLVPFWLGPRLADLLKVTTKEGRQLSDDLDDFVERLRDQPLAGTRPGTRSNPLLDDVDTFRDVLSTRQISALAQAALVETAQQVLEELQAAPLKAEALTAQFLTLAGPDEKRDELLAGLQRLAEIRRVLDRALRAIAELRSPCRIAILTSQMPEGFLDLPGDLRFEMRLGHLTWSETWRWIHRNLPGLLRYGEPYLGRLWARLGPELEQWEELERRVLTTGAGDAGIDEAANEISPRPLESRNKRPGIDPRPRGERPLRLGIAGPHLAGAEALAQAITQLATDFSVGGRVVPGSSETGSLAVLIDEPSPFAANGSASRSDLLQWINRVSERRADIILLDYGSEHPPGTPMPPVDDPDRMLLRSLRHRALLIAASGNFEEGQPKVFFPAAFPEVLAVGSLSDDGRLREYAGWMPEARKPDIFMRDNLVGTPLEEAIKEKDRHLASSLGPGTHGSSFAAFHAVAAAVLVWSTLPSLSPRSVRRLLTQAARRVDGAGAGQEAPRKLDLADAVANARQALVRQTLSAGPCSAQTLAAITGLDLRVVGSTLAGLLGSSSPEVRRLPRGRLERYELIRS